MSRNFLLLTALILLAACGVQRPLMMPRDIPAYERERREKMERLEVKPETESTNDRATEVNK